jgi:hypothetical protein
MLFFVVIVFIGCAPLCCCSWACRKSAALYAASALIGLYQALNWLPVEFPILARSSAYFLLWHFGGRAVFAAVQWLQQRYFEAQLTPGNPAEAQLSTDQYVERNV